MPRPRTKEELVLASKGNYEKLNLLFFHFPNGNQIL